MTTDALNPPGTYPQLQPSMKFTKRLREAGYIQIVATLTSANVLPKEDAMNLATFGKPDEYEVLHLDQKGKKLTVILRHNSSSPNSGDSGR